MSLPEYVRRAADGTLLLELWVQPGASRSEITGLHGGCLRVRLAAPAQGGKANRELLHLLARRLELKPRQLELVAGAGRRRKTVRLLAPETCLDLLPG